MWDHPLSREAYLSKVASTDGPPHRHWSVSSVFSPTTLDLPALGFNSIYPHQDHGTGQEVKQGAHDHAPMDHIFDRGKYQKPIHVGCCEPNTT
jgi:hypothetical protein